MRIVIKRQTWERGRPAESAMLTDYGTYCCLGFFAKECGVEDKLLKHQLTPQDVPQILSDLVLVSPENFDRDTGLSWMFADDSYRYNNLLANCAMEINDDTEITDEERELHLTLLFDLFGHEIVFED